MRSCAWVAGVIAGIVGYVIVNSINWCLDQSADLLHSSLHGKEQAIPNNMRTAPSFSGDHPGAGGGRSGRWSNASSLQRRNTSTPRATRKCAFLSCTLLTLPPLPIPVPILRQLRLLSPRLRTLNLLRTKPRMRAEDIVQPRRI